MLVNLKEIYAYAEERGCAVGAFNCATLESARAAVEAAEALDLPVIIQHAEVHEEYIPIELAADIMLSLAKRSKVPICVHLDHGTSIEYVMKAIRLGFTSVMIDASGLSYEGNLETTRRVVQMAHAVNVTVEAELGNMPHNFRGELKEYTPEDFYTVPEQAAEFAKESGVDCMAISFGTVHGIYKTTPKLNFDVPKRIRELTNGLPLVMHGGSGLSDDDYRKAIAAGVRKINYYTYESLAGGEGTLAAVGGRTSGIQFHDVAMKATEYMRADVARVMKLFNGD